MKWMDNLYERSHAKIEPSPGDALLIVDVQNDLLPGGALAARAAWLAGLNGTATVLAGKEYGIPIFGTMAHSFMEAHDDETLAFEHFAVSQPDAAGAF